MIWSFYVVGSGTNTQTSLITKIVESNSAIYVTGNFNQSFTVNTPVTPSTLTATTGLEPFLIKLDLNGNPLWAKSYPLNGNAQPNNLLVNSGGDLIRAGYVVGNYWGYTAAGTNVFLSRINASTGNMIKLQLSSPAEKQN